MTKARSAIWIKNKSRRIIIDDDNNSNPEVKIKIASHISRILEQSKNEVRKVDEVIKNEILKNNQN